MMSWPRLIWRMSWMVLWVVGIFMQMLMPYTRTYDALDPSPSAYGSF